VEETAPVNPVPALAGPIWWVRRRPE